MDAEGAAAGFGALICGCPEPVAPKDFGLPLFTNRLSFDVCDKAGVDAPFVDLTDHGHNPLALI